jgi:hypothetical protein
MNYIKKNIIVLIAFALPLLLVAGIAITTYLPGAFLSTEYNFVYATCDDGHGYYPYNCLNYLSSRYAVVNGVLTEKIVNPEQDSDNDKIPDIQEGYMVRFFLHDTKANVGREIPLEEVQKLSFSSLITSPDGVSVSSGYDQNPEFLFIFNSGSQHGYYLTKGQKRRKLDLVNANDRYYYDYSFKFIGWVVSPK